MARTWKDTNPSVLCWTQSDEMLLPLRQEYLTHAIITKPQIVAAGHVRLHCPWPLWTKKDIYPHLKPLRTPVSQSTWSPQYLIQYPEGKTPQLSRDL